MSQTEAFDILWDCLDGKKIQGIDINSLVLKLAKKINQLKKDYFEKGYKTAINDMERKGR